MAELGAQIFVRLQKMQAYMSYADMLAPHFDLGSLCTPKEEGLNTYGTEEVVSLTQGAAKGAAVTVALHHLTKRAFGHRLRAPLLASCPLPSPACCRRPSPPPSPTNSAPRPMTTLATALTAGSRQTMAQTP